MPEPATTVTTVAAPTDRLDFVLPDFTRVAWVSDTAREVWQPCLARITSAWREVEWRSVVEGVRSCSVTILAPEEFVAQAPQWAEHGLNSLPVELVGVSDQLYSASAVPTQPGQPFAFRLVVGRPSDVATFKRAWDAGDQEAIGDLLGYPACCREFFRRTWVDEAMVDTTWPMAVASAGAAASVTDVEVAGPPHANILWRWMGARAVPHLPCRFDCTATVELGERLVAVGRAAGFDEEMDWLVEILSWPVEWSALHGIAEIRTPVLKVSTRTDATAGLHRVRRRGTGYPAEGMHGLRFPYRMPVRLRLSESPAFRRGLDHAASTPSHGTDWYASDNGFDSPAEMREAHGPIVQLARSALAGGGGPVIDLGCGNGALLKQVVIANPGVVPFGIDVDPIRIEHARLMLPSFAANLTVADMFTGDLPLPEDRGFALALLMPGRLLEVGSERATALGRWLTEHCDRLLVYAYGDWLDRYGDLAALSREAGLALLAPAGRTAALARFTEVIKGGSNGQ